MKQKLTQCDYSRNHRIHLLGLEECPSERLLLVELSLNFHTHKKKQITLKIIN